MELTTKQIQMSVLGHRRRLKDLRGLGYPDEHPMVAWHVQQLHTLGSREDPSGGGAGTAGQQAEDKEAPGEALAP